MIYRLPVVLVLALGGACPAPSPTPSPEPTIPVPVCEEGQTCSCWHRPPGEPWQQLPPCPTPGPSPTPTPGPGGCVLAGAPSTAAPGQANTLGSEVNRAMKALRPDCEVGGTCLLGDMTQQIWQAQVEAKLREMGLCAGQHAPDTDEVAVAVLDSDPWQGYHIFAGDDSSGPVPPGGARRTVKWSPQAYTGAWLPPSSAPPPPPQACPAPLPDRDPSKLKIVIHVGGGWADGTLQTVGTCDYCAAIGMGEINGVMRCGCPMRSECPGFQCQFREACEAYASVGPVWQTQPVGLEVEHRQGNPWVARAPGAMHLRVCTAGLDVCSAWVAAP